ncbi:O-antigen ligase family protein [Chlorogloeopsis sp. ULAP01]|uniref:O-antigen ligase family protein n=1 Tax=Chlorogloeopsis sp. ULAP01 TaxID=3056483 RepID=UPI0025AA69BE|nr:O-antigen ligase family protein [Chlorogloeopsis sp. ULAP01]MDM9381276.1 O-antigen ligase family protein [Chlorogloeopsis sp. ULAP01]
MNIKLLKTSNLLLYYQCTLAVGAVLIFFTNLDTYLETAVAAPSPKLWIIVFAVASIPLFSTFISRKKYFSLSLLAWLTGYFVISVIYLGLSSQYESSFDEFKSRILTIFFILLMSLIFSQYSIVQTWARRSILAVTFINIITYFYGLMNPSAFVTIIEHQSAELTGRPSGFYVDANRAGCALVSGLILTIGLLPKRYRLPFVVIIFIGIFITFSRSAPITLLIVLVLLISKNEIPRKYVFLGIPLLGIILIVINLLGLNLLDTHNFEYSGLLKDTTIHRINQFESPLSSDAIFDASGQTRLFILELSWQKFLESPFFGWGVGYTLELEKIYNIRPHNMYLLFMLEHGFLGALFLPFLVISVTQNASKRTQNISLAFAALILTWAIFSHNIFEQREFLLMFSLIAAMNVTSHFEQKYQKMQKL